METSKRPVVRKSQAVSTDWHSINPRRASAKTGKNGWVLHPAIRSVACVHRPGAWMRRTSREQARDAGGDLLPAKANLQAAVNLHPFVFERPRSRQRLLPKRRNVCQTAYAE